MTTEAQVSGAGQGRVTPLIALEALGVAFGDIGTNVLICLGLPFLNNRGTNLAISL
jgi:K+ transporter